MTARIYVACLASYNNGTLYGKWIDASDDIAAMNEEIQEMLAGSPCPNVMRQKYRDDDGELRYVDVSAPADKIPDDWEKEGEPFPSAEEWAIHDYEGLGPDLGEYAGLEEVAKRVAIAEVAEDRDIPVSVLIEAMGDAGADDAEDFVDDQYRGEWDSWEDMAVEFVEEMGYLEQIPENLRYYFDFAAYGRDMRLGGDMTAYSES
jgi:antirestriction protein